MSAPDRSEALLERSAELAVLVQAIGEAALRSGRVVVVESHAGLGKTALLAAARDAAVRAGMETLSARGSELERDLGFGVVRQLFAGTARERFAGPARFAAPLLGTDLDGALPAAPGDAVGAALHGLHWLVVNLAERRPLALLVDDLQWCDAASARFLTYLARRLEGLPVLLAVASRPPSRDDPVHEALGRAATPAVVSLRPLSADATRTVVRSFAPAATDEACSAAYRLTGGNPFLVTAVAQDLAAGDRSPGEWSSERVTRAVRERLRGASPEARELARAAAALGAGAELRQAASLSGLSNPRAAAAADELRRLGVLAADGGLDFLHPILRAAVYDDLQPGERATAHGRAARLLAAEGAPPERVALQLLGTERLGDPWTCEQLTLAARESVARGAPEAAVRYLRRALEEPPPADITPQLLFELGAAEGLAFDGAAAAEHLLRSVQVGVDLRQRFDAAVLYSLIEYLGGEGATGVRVLLDLLDEARGDEPIAGLIEAHVASLGNLHASTRPLVPPRIARLRRGVESGALTHASALVAVALELIIGGQEREHAVGLARRAITALRESASLMRDYELHTAVRCLMAADALDEARARIDVELDAVRARGSQLVYLVWASLRSSVVFRMGSVFDAEADARAAYGSVGESGMVAGVPAAASYLIDALLERGELDEAAEILADTGLDGPGEDLADVYPVHLLLHSRARLRLARGETGAAVADAAEVGRRQAAIGELNPAMIPWRSTAALALQWHGDERRARELVAEEVDLARAFGARRAIGIALRAQALIEGSVDLMSEAVDVLAASPARLEHARALAGLGELRIAGGDLEAARAPLLEALELAHTCGAAELEARVLDALRATGVRPRRAMLTGPDALTPSERRVAEMVADGRSNREVAEALFVTVRTVESHLSTAYRKLGISSRRDVARALAR